MGLNHKKTGGRKSCDTLPLIRNLENHHMTSYYIDMNFTSFHGVVKIAVL